MKTQSSKLKTQNFNNIKPGQIIKVFWKIKEDKKERVQPFEGTVIARKHGSEKGATITVRREKGGFGVEKIFPINSPLIDKIEIIRENKVRRAKLYYLRDKK